MPLVVFITISVALLAFMGYVILTYRWLDNLQKRIEGFYVGLYHGLQIPVEKRHRFHLSNSHVTVFWLTSLPLLCLPLVCLEIGLILERRRAARNIVFCVYARSEQDPNSKMRREFVALPGPSKFAYLEEPSHMLFGQTKPGQGLRSFRGVRFDATGCLLPQQAPKPLKPITNPGSISATSP